MGVHRARLARHRDSDDSRTVQVMGDHKAACPKPLASTTIAPALLSNAYGAGKSLLKYRLHRL